MTVTISRDQQPPFRGFFVQVRDAAAPAGAPPLGQFFTRSHSLVSCGTGRNVSQPRRRRQTDRIHSKDANVGPRRARSGTDRQPNLTEDGGLPVLLD